MQNASKVAFCNTLTFIKLPFVIMIFVLSISEWLFNTSFTVVQTAHKVISMCYFGLVCFDVLHPSQQLWSCRDGQSRGGGGGGGEQTLDLQSDSLPIALWGPVSVHVCYGIMCTY